MDELIVVAAHGPDWIGPCLDSLAEHTTGRVLVVDTGSRTVPGAHQVLPGGYPTGAYRWAYEHEPAGRYLFMQDSMTAVADPLPWFRDQLPDGGGAVAWGLFPMQWDDAGQADWVQSRYPGATALAGIFGPVFYADHASLERLAAADLLPPAPASRWEAQATERAWAFAFAAAGLPVAGPVWDSARMRAGFGPFAKTWAGRP